MTELYACLIFTKGILLFVPGRKGKLDLHAKSNAFQCCRLKLMHLYLSHAFVTNSFEKKKKISSQIDAFLWLCVFKVSQFPIKLNMVSSILK